MPDVSITLRNRNISVDKQSIPVSVAKGEKVKWTSSDGVFSIEFKTGSDWQNPKTRQDGGVWVAECGPFNKPDSKLHYSVTAPDHAPLDPEIDIRP